MPRHLKYEITEDLLKQINASIKKVGNCWFWTGKYHRGSPGIVLKGRLRDLQTVILQIKNKYAWNNDVKMLCRNEKLCVNPDHISACIARFNLEDQDEIKKAIDTFITKAGDCLIWNGQLSHRGKPAFRNNGKSRIVINWIFNYTYDEPINNSEVLVNKCGTEDCVNLNHYDLEKR